MTKTGMLSIFGRIMALQPITAFKTQSEHNHSSIRDAGFGFLWLFSALRFQNRQQLSVLVSNSETKQSLMDRKHIFAFLGKTVAFEVMD